MTRARLLFLLPLSIACAALFTACPTDNRRDDFDYLRSPITFRMDPVPSDHPFCLDPAKRMGLSEQACRDASKYRLRWDRPEDTVGFAQYRIYVDTTPPNSPLLWPNVRKESALASFILDGAAPLADSIIFILSDTGAVPRYLARATPGLVALDTTGRQDSSGRLIFAIITGYRNAGLDGLPRYTWVITDDRFAPFAPAPKFTPKSRSVEITWERPRDLTSFFEPGADSGIILAYYLRIVRGGILHANRPPHDSLFLPRADLITYTIGGVDRSAEVTLTKFKTRREASGRLFRLPDSNRVQSRNAPDLRDSIRVTIRGLTPQDTVDIGLWAVDAAGNLNSIDSGAYTRVLLTDLTQPTRPNLRILDSTRNGFVYAFTASRDLVVSGGDTVPAASPNANIQEYRITRKRLGNATSGVTVRDTIIQISASRRGDTAFTDTMRYLPPGTTYLLTVQAMDSTGHLSETDSITVSTTMTSFPDGDSGASCPPGFVAMPGGWFMRGDSTATFEPDEKPSFRRYQQSFCIEALEHQDVGGAFVTRKTWQQAHDICADLSASMTPADSTWLCTESEWERACEGVEPDLPLVYGMQSEKKNPGGVRYACNIGTGDSAMALTAALRDPTCISYEGALDMAGNLAEWVLDPHTSLYPSTLDTLRRGTPHTLPTSSSRRGIRGSHYLNPKESPATLLKRARCSNRDYPTQIRPVVYPGCVSASGPQIVALYTDRTPRCLPLPDTIPADRISSVSIARDSTQLLLLLKGVAQPYTYQMPVTDTVYRGKKPFAASTTTQTLAVVDFRNSVTLETIRDTLPAREILGASQATLDAVFGREAAPPWAVVKQGGVYAVQILWAYAYTDGRDAKAYFSNTAVGFRCCSKPRP